MRVPVVLQDRALRLPSGRPQLRVLLVSGAVLQRRDPDLTGRAAKDAGEDIGGRGEVEREGEEAARARKGGIEQGAHGGNEDRKRKRHEAKQRPTPPSAAGNQQEGEEVG